MSSTHTTTMSARALALCLLVAAACGGPQSPEDEGLPGSVRSYAEAILWHKNEVAALHRLPAVREAFLAKRDALDDDLRVVEYEIARLKMSDTDSTGLVLVKYRWHLDSEGIVHQTTVAQHWQRQGRQWTLLTEQLERGPPMPGLDPGGAANPDSEDTASEAPVPETRGAPGPSGLDLPAAAE